MGDVVVIGGGITGIQAALDVANHGIRVHLIEREPSIGGHMAQLDKTFPTNDCSMCILSPKMAEVQRHPLITLYTCSEVERVEGEVGHFTVTVKKFPRYIDEVECTGCGDCVLICPVEVYNRYDAGIGVRKAIYKPHQQAMPDIVIKDSEHCIECGLCYGICDKDAIKKDDSPTTTEIEAASIIIACGYVTFDAVDKEQFGYRVLPDVITSLELERMMSAGGPTGGELRRLSNGHAPRHVVFIQCVGSRDIPLGRPYCSGVCCMSAVKNAMLIKEKHPEVTVSICYMDIRAYGKGYEEYYERAKGLGVQFIRGMPSEVIGDDDGMTLQVENTETEEFLILHPDLIILSVGLGPAEDIRKISENLRIPLEEEGFIRPLDAKINTVATIRPGIYAAGTAVSPRDIPDCVAHAGAAAMRAFMDASRDG
jgi:heterodisulfide reductase subunit A